MYTMTLDGNPFFDPRVEEYALEDPIIDREANRLARMTFTIYPDHPCYSSITLFGSMIRVFRDGALMLVMRPIKRTREMMDGMAYECEEWMGTMRDYVARPTALGVVEYLGALIDYCTQWMYTYISNVPYRYNSAINTVTSAFSAEIAAEGKKYALEGYKTVWDYLNEYVINKFDGLFFYAEYMDEQWTSHCHIESELPVGEQAIEFGDNMKDLFIETGGDGFFTRLIPLGADKSTSKSYRNNGGGNKTPLTVVGQPVPSNEYGATSTDLDYIADYEFEKRYHIYIAHAERWPTIKTASALLSKGLAWFNEHKLLFSNTVRLTALDAHDLNADIDALEFMTRVYCYSQVHGIGAYYVVRKQHLCLADPSQSEIEIGTETPSLTDLTTATARKSSNTIDAIDDRVFGLEET